MSDYVAVCVERIRHHLDQDAETADMTSAMTYLHQLKTSESSPEKTDGNKMKRKRKEKRKRNELN